MTGSGSAGRPAPSRRSASGREDDPTRFRIRSAPKRRPLIGMSGWLIKAKAGRLPGERPVLCGRREVGELRASGV